MCGCHGHRGMHSALPHRHRLSVWPAPPAACSVACLHINVSDVWVPWAPTYALSITSQTPVECLASSACIMQCSMLAHQCDRCAGAMATEVCFQHCLRHRLSVWPAPLAACSVACCTLAWQMCGCHGHRCMHSALPHRHPLSVWPAPLAACSVACLHISVTDVRVPWAPRYAFSITSQTPVECLASSAGSMQCCMLAHQCDRCAGAMGTEVCIQHFLTDTGGVSGQLRWQHAV